jgi:hypothetical protein
MHLGVSPCRSSRESLREPPSILGREQAPRMGSVSHAHPGAMDASLWADWRALRSGGVGMGGGRGEETSCL